TFEGHKAPTWAADISPASDLIATAGMDGLVKIWTADVDDPIRTLAGHEQGGGVVTFAPDGKTVATAGARDGTVSLWATDGGELQYTIASGGVYAVAFSPDGSMLATSCADQTVRVWDVKTGALRYTFAGGGLCVAFSPDGKRLAGGGGDKLVYLWDVPAAE